MSRPARLILFGLAAACLGVVVIYGFAGLPDFGRYHGVYGQVLNGIGVNERHATDLVTALNFDVRGFDTLGEEFILYASVLGIVLILRDVRDERHRPQREAAEEHQFTDASDALRTAAALLIPLMVALGVYIVVHGHLTPGGGFQGGIVLAVGPLAVFLAGRYLRMRRIAPHDMVEAGESLGALGYALVGLGGLVFVGIFFKNFLPFGTPGHLLSAGQMPLASIAVGLEVSGAFLVAWTEFLDQALLVRRGGG